MAPNRSTRILLSEGSSLSAREAITALGLAGCTVDLCDPNPFCPACWEGPQKAIHLIYSHEEETCIRWDCKTCKQMFLINKPQQPRGGNITPGAYFGENGWMAR